MKKVIALLSIVAFFLLNSCDPAATFDKPQPDNLNPLTSFPVRIQGKYVSADQASIITITDKLITRHYDFDFKDHKDSLGSSFKLVGDTLIDKIDGTKEIVVVKGDTIIQHINRKDTLFNISADNILKKFKGYYFLNSKYRDNSWEVKELSLKRSVLSIGSILDKKEVEKLKEITETNMDTTSTHFTLTRKQFKRFIKQEGFGEHETFNRITENGM